jgi:hypothetical protein
MRVPRPTRATARSPAWGVRTGGEDSPPGGGFLTLPAALRIVGLATDTLTPSWSRRGPVGPEQAPQSERTLQGTSSVRAQRALLGRPTPPRKERGVPDMRSPRHFLCVDCEHTWTTPFRGELPEACPRCGSPCFGRLIWNHDDDLQQVRGARQGTKPWRLGKAASEDRYVG